MNRIQTITIVVVLACLLGGCGPSERRTDGPAPESSAVAGSLSTRIDPEMAAMADVVTATASPGRIDEVITVYGRAVSNPEAVSEIRARFPGLVRRVNVSEGDRVAAGMALADVESDESLTRYTIRAPIPGVVLDRNINPGEHTGGRVLFSIVDPTSMWGAFAIFPGDRSRVVAGLTIDVSTETGETLGDARIGRMGLTTARDQSVTAFVVLANASGAIVPGQHLNGRIHVATHDAGVVVDGMALQSISGAQVVFVREGDVYEARTVRTGRRDLRYVEILDGVEAGETYVAGNSYLIKADLEKNAAGLEE
ncbi:MAG: efflux RND transporter periplasmic adaptor subunit [Pseudomonadales bacterium]